jgi:hypothetical protein
MLHSPELVKIRDTELGASAWSQIEPALTLFGISAGDELENSDHLKEIVATHKTASRLQLVV